MYGYAFRRALRYRAETWHGGKGWAHLDHPGLSGVKSYMQAPVACEEDRCFPGGANFYKSCYLF